MCRCRDERYEQAANRYAKAAHAPGWPGGEPRWTSSAKTGVGTSLGNASRVWFTLSHGILNEIYYPRLDSPCTRDIGLIVTDGRDFFSAEKRHTRSQVSYPVEGVPLYRLINTCRASRYRIDKDILADPARDAQGSARTSFRSEAPSKIIVFTSTKPIVAPWGSTWRRAFPPRV